MGCFTVPTFNNFTFQAKTQTLIWIQIGSLLSFLHPSFSATFPPTETPQSAMSPASVMSDMGTCRSSRSAQCLASCTSISSSHLDCRLTWVSRRRLGRVFLNTVLHLQKHLAV